MYVHLDMNRICTRLLTDTPCRLLTPASLLGRVQGKESVEREQVEEINELLRRQVLRQNLQDQHTSMFFRVSEEMELKYRDSNGVSTRHGFDISHITGRALI
ncbi:hypothetical protein INR49_020563 [Caranx melampygus]|nr:hypothetical protein INR49_020563 [Caranx melampygus]